MTSDHYGFYFESQGLAGAQGPNDPSGEYFSSSEIADSLSREVIQNSLDARAKDGQPVRVVFELRSVRTDEVPGISRLRSAISSTVEATDGLQGAHYMVNAAAAANKPAIKVLRIGDYGTVGLRGSESVATPQSALSTLTRSTGASAGDGQRGGSFGIGSAVGPFASNMRTVAYVTIPAGDQRAVFAATAKLASHKDEHGEWRQGTGYFTDLRVTDDFNYLRDLACIPGFEPRTQVGTDVYILDYRDAEEDSELNRIRRATLTNFYAAIHRGALVVEAITDSGGWVLDVTTLRSAIESDDVLVESLLPFYRALADGQLVEQVLTEVGPVELRVWVDPQMSRKYGTHLMRSPLMTVQTVASPFSIPFAAVFICSNEKGNEILRETEPPTHDRWTERGPRSNRKAVWELRAFIKEELRRILPEQVGARASIAGLAALLPQIKSAEHAESVAEDRTSTGNSGTDESPVLLGRSQNERAAPRVMDATTVEVRREGMASPDGAEDGESGRKRGDKPNPPIKPKPRPGPYTPSEPGPGRSRIRSRDVRFRSYADSLSGTSVIVLTAPIDLFGDLELAALGGGDREVYGAEIVNVVAETPAGLSPLAVSKSTIENLELEKGVPLRLHVVFAKGSRYRLGVKDV